MTSQSCCVALKVQVWTQSLNQAWQRLSSVQTYLRTILPTWNQRKHLQHQRVDCHPSSRLNLFLFLYFTRSNMIFSQGQCAARTPRVTPRVHSVLELPDVLRGTRLRCLAPSGQQITQLGVLALGLPFPDLWACMPLFFLLNTYCKWQVDKWG